MIETGPNIVPLGESAWTVVLGDKISRALNQRVTGLVARIASAQPERARRPITSRT